MSRLISDVYFSIQRSPCNPLTSHNKYFSYFLLTMIFVLVLSFWDNLTYKHLSHTLVVSFSLLFFSLLFLINKDTEKKCCHNSIIMQILSLLFSLLKLDQNILQQHIVPLVDTFFKLVYEVSNITEKLNGIWASVKPTTIGRKRRAKRAIWKATRVVFLWMFY